MRIAPWIALALSFAQIDPAHASAFAVEDLRRLESFGSILVDPTGRWLVFEQRGAAGTAEAFDHQDWSGWPLNQLKIVDLKAPHLLRALTDETLRGFTAGPFSPDGKSLVVARLRDHQWTAGVLSIPGGRFTALDVAPEDNRQGQTVLWRSDHELLMIAKPPGGVPEDLDRGWAGPVRTARLWARQARGQDSGVAIGSGRYLDQRPRPEPNRLVVIETRGGAARELARGDFDDMALDPTGQRLAIVERTGDVQPAAGQPVNMATPLRQRRLSILNLTSGAVMVACPGLDLSVATLSWSPRGDRLVIHARRDGEDWPKARLLAVRPGGACDHPAAPGVALPPAPGPQTPAPVSMAWMGASLLVLGHAVGALGARQDWMVVRDGTASPLTSALPHPPQQLLLARPSGIWVRSSGQVWRVSAAGAAAKVGPGGAADGDLAGSGWSMAYPVGQPFYPRIQGQLATAAAYSLGRGRRLVRPDRPGLVLALPDPASRPMAWADAAGGVVTLARDDHGVETLALRTARGQTPLARVNGWLADRAPFRTLALAHRGPGGEALKSWLYLPADWTPGRRPPLIVAPYPGAVYPTPSTFPGAPNAAINVSVLTGLGYAVLEPSLPRGPGRDPAAGLADQILGIVDLAVRGGYVDGDRLALWGHSYGGWGAMTVATQTARFKAIIVSAGVSDILSAHGTFVAATRARPEGGVAIAQAAAWAESGQGGLGAPPWEEVGPYLRNSPVLNAGAIVTPMLLLHGDQDFVPLGQAEEMFSALYRQGKDAALVTYFGEAHGFDSPGNAADVYRRVVSWLEDNLTPRPLPSASSPAAGGRSPPPSDEPTLPASRPATGS